MRGAETETADLMLDVGWKCIDLMRRNEAVFEKSLTWKLIEDLGWKVTDVNSLSKHRRIARPVEDCIFRSCQQQESREGWVR
jgi:hypothetical protein